MSISYETLIARLEQEVQQAKRASGSQRQQHLYSVRMLADLALEGADSAPAKPLVSSAGMIPPAQPYQPPQQQAYQSPVLNEKPLQTEDGSNGDSLFDF